MVTNGGMFLDVIGLYLKVLFRDEKSTSAYIFPFQGAIYGPHAKIHEILTRLRSVEIHPLGFFFLQIIVLFFKGLALEFDFRVIISCQYFLPKAKLTKARLHSTKTIV